MPQQQQRKYGYHCEICQGHRLHSILLHDPGRGSRKARKTIRIRVCSACGEKTPLTYKEQPGLACPVCSNVVFKVCYTRSVFKSIKVECGPGLHTYQQVGAIERVKRCTHCSKRIRTTEEVECLNV